MPRESEILVREGETQKWRMSLRVKAAGVFARRTGLVGSLRRPVTPRTVLLLSRLECSCLGVPLALNWPVCQLTSCVNVRGHTEDRSRPETGDH